MRFIFLLLIFFSYKAFSQSDFDTEQHEAFALLMAEKEEESKEYIENNILSSKDLSRQVIGLIYLSQYYEFTDKSNNTKQLEYIEKAKKISDKTNNAIDKAYVNFGYAMYYKTINRWDHFVKHLWNSLNTFKQYPNENFMISRLYITKYKASTQNPLDKTNIEGYNLALKHAEKAKNNILMASIYLHMGTYYAIQEKDLTQAKACLDKSYKISKKIKNKDNAKILMLKYYSNVGAYYNGINNLELALENLNAGLKLLSKTDSTYICSFNNNIGTVYILNNNLNTGLTYFLKANEYSNNISNVQQIQILNNISETYEKLKNYEKSLEYLKISRDKIKEEGIQRYNYNSQSLENFYKTEEKNILLAEENTRYENQKKYLIGIILLTFFSTVVLIYMLYYKQKLNKQKTKFLESEKEKLKIEKELSELKQEHYQKQVLAASIQLEQKKKFLEDLNKNITNNKDFNLTSYLKGEHFVDKNLSNIHDIIKEVHPNFFKKLQKISINKLTNLDIKYAAYIYMNMDNSQIASILNVDPKTVSVTKYRLKQKLGLSKEIDLESFLKNLE